MPMFTYRLELSELGGKPILAHEVTVWKEKHRQEIRT